MLRPDVYERLAEGASDDNWTAEELDRLREEAVSILDRYGRNE